MTLPPALRGIATLSVALLAAACAQHQMATLPAVDAESNVAAADSAPEPARSGGDSTADPSFHSRNKGATQLAMLPAPTAPAQPKATPPGHGVCSPVQPGAEARGLVESGGLRFRVECFRAAGVGPAPAVVILHGSRGIGRNTIYARLAGALNERGIHAFVFEYLTPDAPPAAQANAAPAKSAGKTPVKTDVLRPQGQQQQAGKIVTPAAPKPVTIGSAQQAAAISDAITAAQNLPYVDPRRIGMFGLSLGGFHALGLAARDTRIAAVVDMFGAMPHAAAPDVTRMPPVLILHGDRDAVVPVRRAYELDKLMARIGAPREMTIYRGQGHSFRGAADADSVARSADFLDRRLAAAVQAAN